MTESTDPRTPTIVVGVDPSPASHAAVRWAAQEARLRGARLLLVHAYSPMPPLFAAGPVPVPVPQAAFDEVRTHAEHLVAAAAAEVDTGVPVVMRVAPGPAGPVLESLSGDAELLVVGTSAHHAAVVRMALGSVAQHCVNHARCPVVVVPAVVPAHPVTATGRELAGAR